MCDNSRFVAFRTSFRGIEYEARVSSVEEGVEITLSGFDSFEDLVSRLGEGLSADEVTKVAANERERCMLEGIQRLRGDLE